MAHFELECPKCGKALELDEAFADGVCRCSECGVLLAVTGSPNHGQAEAKVIDRRDRPDIPEASSRPPMKAGEPAADAGALGTSPFPSPQVLTRARSDRPQRQGTTVTSRPPTATHQPARDERPKTQRRRASESLVSRYWLVLAIVIAAAVLGAVAAGVLWLG